MDICLLIIAILVDGVFLTIFYHHKYKIKHYIIFLTFLCIMSFLLQYYVQNIYITLAQTFIIAFALILWTKDRLALLYFEIPMSFIFLLDILTYEVFGSEYLHGYIVNMLIKILIISLSEEWLKLKVVGKMENFTIKTLILIFLFANLLVGIYLSS